MISAQIRLQHADNERMLLGRQLASAASRRAGPWTPSNAIAPSNELEWILPASGIALLTLAMVSAVVFLP
jgi:hypothetical protein